MDLEGKFQELKARKEGAQMTHIYYGDPSEEFSIRLIETLANNGADIIEFGIPFSDPIADARATFQAACERALKAGITPAKCIEGIRRLRNMGLEAPMVVTTYFNVPYVMGFRRFLERVKGAGVQAVLIPDLPFEETEPLMGLVAEVGLKLILQVAPTTASNRLQKILKKARGFVYFIGVEGVTGARVKKLNSTLILIEAIKDKASIPLLVGVSAFQRGGCRSHGGCWGGRRCIGKRLRKNIYSKFK